MLSPIDLQDIIGYEFFDGNLQIAGIVMYVAALAIMFAFIKNRGEALILSIPITMVFSILGILSSDVTILLLIVIALALAFNAKRAL